MVVGNWDDVTDVRVVGFIEKLGGIYEVEVVQQPALNQFFDTFKAAMDYFDCLEHDAENRGRMQAGAA